LRGNNALFPPIIYLSPHNHETQSTNNRRKHKTKAKATNEGAEGRRQWMIDDVWGWDDVAQRTGLLWVYFFIFHFY
jgi:hypothetical protein